MKPTYEDNVKASMIAFFDVVSSHIRDDLDYDSCIENHPSAIDGKPIESYVIHRDFIMLPNDYGFMLSKNRLTLGTPDYELENCHDNLIMIVRDSFHHNVSFGFELLGASLYLESSGIWASFDRDFFDDLDNDFVSIKEKILKLDLGIRS